MTAHDADFKPLTSANDVASASHPKSVEDSSFSLAQPQHCKLFEIADTRQADNGLNWNSNAWPAAQAVGRDSDGGVDWLQWHSRGVWRGVNKRAAARRTGRRLIARCDAVVEWEKQTIDDVRDKSRAAIDSLSGSRCVVDGRGARWRWLVHVRIGGSSGVVRQQAQLIG